ncbi:MAG: hypothetical protein FWE14_09795 [Lachnospiraceae bacterium]|nr:hypothetical protein [Lachnospiraceae bacterium]
MKRIVTIIAVTVMLFSMSLLAHAQTSFPHPPHNQNLTGSKNYDFSLNSTCWLQETLCYIISTYENRDAFCGNCHAPTGTKNVLISTRHFRC